MTLLNDENENAINRSNENEIKTNSKLKIKQKQKADELLRKIIKSENKS